MVIYIQFKFNDIPFVGYLVMAEDRDGQKDVQTDNTGYKNCPRSHTNHFVKNYIFCNKLLHAYVQWAYIVKAKYKNCSTKSCGRYALS